VIDLPEDLDAEVVVSFVETSTGTAWLIWPWQGALPTVALDRSSLLRWITSESDADLVLNGVSGSGAFVVPSPGG